MMPIMMPTASTHHNGNTVQYANTGNENADSNAISEKVAIEPSTLALTCAAWLVEGRAGRRLAAGRVAASLWHGDRTGVASNKSATGVGDTKTCP
jgi:hypothetical protein